MRAGRLANSGTGCWFVARDRPSGAFGQVSDPQRTRSVLANSRLGGCARHSHENNSVEFGLTPDSGARTSPTQSPSVSLRRDKCDCHAWNVEGGRLSPFMLKETESGNGGCGARFGFSVWHEELSRMRACVAIWSTGVSCCEKLWLFCELVSMGCTEAPPLARPRHPAPKCARREARCTGRSRCPRTLVHARARRPLSPRTAQRRLPRLSTNRTLVPVVRTVPGGGF